MGFYFLNVFFYFLLRWPMMRAVAFFDVQNLYRHAKDAFGHTHPNFDPVKLHKAVCVLNGWNVDQIRYYTGIPQSDRSPMWHDYWANRILSLKRQNIQTVTRPIRYRDERIIMPDGSIHITTTPQEKGIDVRLAVDLISMAYRRLYDVAVIYSQDQDLAEVVEEVHSVSSIQGRTIELACAFPVGPHASAKRGINRTRWIKMDQNFYEQCLDPRDYRRK
jgi:uncharacterized LabA/DUF88 family protein